MHILPETIKRRKSPPWAFSRWKMLKRMFHTSQKRMILYDLLRFGTQVKMQWLIDHNYVRLEPYNDRTRRVRITDLGRFALEFGIL